MITPSPGTAAFDPGQAVRVRALSGPGHIRTPYFIRGKRGVVDAVAGAYKNPEDLAYGRRDGPDVTLYRVLFKQVDVWPAYDGPANDILVVDIYGHWLEAA